MAVVKLGDLIKELEGKYSKLLADSSTKLAVSALCSEIESKIALSQAGISLRSVFSICVFNTVLSGVVINQEIAVRNGGGELSPSSYQLMDLLAEHLALKSLLENLYSEFVQAGSIEKGNTAGSLATLFIGSKKLMLALLQIEPHGPSFALLADTILQVELISTPQVKELSMDSRLNDCILALG